MIRLAALLLALLVAGCKTCPALDFPRAADVTAITAPRPKIPPAALDPENPTAAANYQSADRRIEQGGQRFWRPHLPLPSAIGDAGHRVPKSGRLVAGRPPSRMSRAAKPLDLENKGANIS